MTAERLGRWRLAAAIREDGAVIGACSFVNRDVPPGAEAAGVPCRPIGPVEVNDGGEVSLRCDCDRE